MPDPSLGSQDEALEAIRQREAQAGIDCVLTYVHSAIKNLEGRGPLAPTEVGARRDLYIVLGLVDALAKACDLDSPQINPTALQQARAIITEEYEFAKGRLISDMTIAVLGAACAEAAAEHSKDIIAWTIQHPFQPGPELPDFAEIIKRNLQ